MVAKTPPTKQRRALVALNPNQVRETLKKVDQCMARLQELQYTVTGGSKVVSGVNLSPRSTRAYFRTSLRCKQESLRMKGTPAKKSPMGKFQGCNTGDWRRTSLPAMLLGETVVEILQASQFAKQLVATAENLSKISTAPKTPIQAKFNPIMDQNHTPLRARRTKEKQNPQKRGTRCESRSPPVQVRARARIQFKSISPTPNRPSTSANRISPKNRPWAKKTILFPNPTFMPTASTPVPVSGDNMQRFYKTRSPIIPKATKVQTPHKFVIKSPPKCLGTQLKYQKALPVQAAKSPIRKVEPVKPRRCSFSPVKMISILASPLKSRISPRKSFGGMISGLKQRPGSRSTLRASTSKMI
ncbi:Microtubule-binding protein TANGLED1 [Rhynchospora pubera]|uniref:Microtubule-binding protein TANGLED1 n=1 Tax=Rhynchospora pubera TaxID=906938 RepID=A0AAV8C911_9POAL|nr:Microtubule-binding protein TANGLED1 [Rhynchospora pubera]